MKEIGACFGSLMAGPMLAKGRRKSLIISGFIYIVAALLCQFMNFWLLFLSRLVGGFATGAILTTTSRIIEEYVPLAMYSTASPFNIFCGQLGTFLALMAAILLPSEDASPQEYADTNSWRYIFGIEFILIGIGLIGYLFVVRLDTPKFYLT